MFALAWLSTNTSIGFSFVKLSGEARPGLASARRHRAYSADWPQCGSTGRYITDRITPGAPSSIIFVPVPGCTSARVPALAARPGSESGIVGAPGLASRPLAEAAKRDPAPVPTAIPTAMFSKAASQGHSDPNADRDPGSEVLLVASHHHTAVR